MPTKVPINIWNSQPAMQPDVVLLGSGKRGWSLVGEQESHLKEVSDQMTQRQILSSPGSCPRHSTMHLLGPSLLLLGKDCGLGLGSGMSVGAGGGGELWSKE